MVYEIPQELVQALIEYLARRPYIEVEQAMQALRALKPAAPAHQDMMESR